MTDITQEELDALPTCGDLRYKEEIRDGKKVRIPYMNNPLCLMMERFVVDARGDRWMVGTANGIRYKSPMRML